MSLFREQSFGSSLLGKWMTDTWLITPQANRFFFACSLVNAMFVVAIVLVFWGGRPWNRNLIQLPQVRIALGLLGGLGAITGTMLMDGTRKYWRDLDSSPVTQKKFWFWVLYLGVNIGSCFYYFCVYRAKLNEGRRNSNA